MSASLTLAAILATAGALQLMANLGYDDALSRFDDTLADTRLTLADVEALTDELRTTSDTATLLVESDSGVLADPGANETLRASVAAADDTAASAEELLTEPMPEAEAKPIVFWELFGAAEELDVEVEGLRTLDSELSEESPGIASATDDVTADGLALVESAATAASAFEAVHLSAKNDDVIALRDAATTAAGTSVLDDTAVSSFIALQDAAGQVVAGEKTELAEKAGPLQGTRLEIEAFARSLAPGVLLEFDWNTIVNGAGYNGSMGGLTTWWWDEPDRALIELSNSVAEQWPGDRSKALVAHEVGHAISVKCEEMYDSSTQDSIEKWATAWAISKGFTDDANGVWAYGYPPQSYIDAAAGCR
ncbi:hypothetical protein [Microbacterium hydrocarbonoxydans]|uniref:hypothetical protein n=1 Tax=Microbacterium hydrocarbonoxydans TaxID=273678 RepID=UPI0007678FA4|nr:hypothetical protein [Microbacterium hydrocarbonoxydans]